MKRIFILLFLLTNISVFSQKEIKVVSFKQSSSDISARTNQREDTKGIACALIKVQLPIPNAIFEGDIIGRVAHKTNEYLVYMPQNSIELGVKMLGNPLLSVKFKDYGIDKLESKTTYELCLLQKEPNVPQLFDEGMEALVKNDIFTAFDKLEKSADAGYAKAHFVLGENILLPYTAEEYAWNAYDWTADANDAESYQTAYEHYKKAADAGIPEALYALGVFLSDYNQAKRFVDENDASDACKMANIYKTNIPQEYCDDSYIQKLFEEAADRGLKDAQWKMCGDDNWCKKNAAKGIAIAEFAMGLRYDEELRLEEYLMLTKDKGSGVDLQMLPLLEYALEMNRTENFETAFSWYLKAANHGLDAAQWRIGEMYARGLGVEPNIEKAIAWRTKAAEQGCPVYQFVMGMMYIYGGFSDYSTYIYPDYFKYRIDVPADIDKADKWMRMLSNKELSKKEKDLIETNGRYSASIDELASLLHNRGDYNREIYWYQRGIDWGYRDSYCSLGEMYYKGLGVSKDYEKARELFEKADMDDDHFGDGYSGELRNRAKAYIGVIYRDGLGVEPNIMKAKTYLMASANKNDAKGMYELALLLGKEGKSEEANKLLHELKNGWGFDDIDDYYKNRANEAINGNMGKYGE